MSRAKRQEFCRQKRARKQNFFWNQSGEKFSHNCEINTTGETGFLVWSMAENLFNTRRSIRLTPALRTFASHVLVLPFCNPCWKRLRDFGFARPPRHGLSQVYARSFGPKIAVFWTKEGINNWKGQATHNIAWNNITFLFSVPLSFSFHKGNWGIKRGWLVDSASPITKQRDINSLLTCGSLELPHFRRDKFYLSSPSISFSSSLAQKSFAGIWKLRCGGCSSVKNILHPLQDWHLLNLKNDWFVFRLSSSEKSSCIRSTGAMPAFILGYCQHHAAFQTYPCMPINHASVSHWNSLPG